MTAIRTFGLTSRRRRFRRDRGACGEFRGSERRRPGLAIHGTRPYVAGPYAPGPYAAGPTAPARMAPAPIADAGLRGLPELRIRAASVRRTGGRAAAGAGRAGRYDDAADARLADALLPFGPNGDLPHGELQLETFGQVNSTTDLSIPGSEHALHVCSLEYPAVGVGQCADMELVAGANRRLVAQTVARCGPVTGA